MPSLPTSLSFAFYFTTARPPARLPARAGTDGNNARLNDKVGQEVGQGFSRASLPPGRLGGKAGCIGLRTWSMGGTLIILTFFIMSQTIHKPLTLIQYLKN